VALIAPVPRPPYRLSAFIRRPLDDALTSSWVLAGPSPFTWMKADRQLRFADVVPDTCVSDATPARPPFTLTATLFGALRGSLFEVRMLLADFCNETRRTDTSPGLSFPRRDDGHDHLPVLTCHARPPPVGFRQREAVTRGEPRFPSVRFDPGAGSSCLRRFARPRYRSDRATGLRVA